MISARLVRDNIIQCKRKTEKYSQTMLFRKGQREALYCSMRIHGKETPQYSQFTLQTLIPN
jgi:hypothetical protein